MDTESSAPVTHGRYDTNLMGAARHNQLGLNSGKWLTRYPDGTVKYVRPPRVGNSRAQFSRGKLAFESAAYSGGEESLENSRLRYVLFSRWSSCSDSNTLVPDLHSRGGRESDGFRTWQAMEPPSNFLSRRLRVHQIRAAVMENTRTAEEIATPMIVPAPAFLRLMVRVYTN